LREPDGVFGRHTPGVIWERRSVYRVPIGAHVVINGRTKERVEKAIGDIHKTVLNASLSGVAADLATAAGAASLVAQVKIADILVNNIGSLTMKPFAELTDEDWAWLFDLNVMRGVRLTRHYLPGMVERGWTGP
jgi:NADP-dependent 3-hydroxy acid dehydrogenase YdfG